MLLLIIKTIAGLAVLLFSGEILVRAAVSLARALKMSPALIGMTILAYGTSSPEFFISMKAALDGASGIALGNVVGSNIANILLVLGVSALIYPITIQDRDTRTQSYTMLAVALLCCAAAYAGGFPRLTGGIFVLLSIVYSVYLVRKSRHNAELREEAAQELPDSAYSTPVAAALICAGIAGLTFGASLLVDGASGLAIAMSVSEAAIGVTVVALGGSLPELVTSVIAAYKRHSDMAAGNVIGSNIFNILAVLGGAAAVSPPDVPAQMLRFDFPALAVVTVIAVLFIAVFGKISRVAGALFAGAYLTYCAAQFV